ncbi:MAG: hypothetical protein ACTSYF_07055 [Promethearchaeota archaeon]
MIKPPLKHIFKYEGKEYWFRSARLEDLMNIPLSPNIDSKTAEYLLHISDNNNLQNVNILNNKSYLQFIIDFAKGIEKLNINEPPIKFSEWKPFDFIKFQGQFTPFLYAEVMGTPIKEASGELNGDLNLI